MSKFLKALRVAGDVAEIIVASSIVVEFINLSFLPDEMKEGFKAIIAEKLNLLA